MVSASEVEKVIKNSTCPSDCKCFALNPDELCKVRKTGVDSLLECLNENPADCGFSVQFGGTYYCKCATRIELAKLLEGN